MCIRDSPRATQASSICNGESAGNPSLASGVDKCSDGNSFSFGLFQINIIACLLYTSDAADERSSVDLGGRRIIKKKKSENDSGVCLH